MNQENNFNNQNNGYNSGNDYNPNNYNQNSYEPNNYQNFDNNMNTYQNVPNQNNNEKEEPKKNNNLLVIILLLLVIGLAGFIVYDKVLKKEEVKEPEKSVENKPGDVTTKEPENYIQSKIITQNVNNKEIDIEFKYFLTEEENDSDEDNIETDYIVEYDVYINRKKINDNSYGRYYYGTKAENSGALSTVISKIKNSQEMQNIIKRSTINVGIIKSNYDYLYLEVFNFEMTGATAKLLVFDQNYNVILDKKTGTSGRGIQINNSCINYDKFKNYVGNYDNYDGNNPSLYYIEDSKIYYLEDNGSCSDNVLKEYKISLTNNQAVVEEIATCSFEADGACA